MLAHVSASQVDAFKRCPRYWHYRHVQKIEQPKTLAQEKGTAIHASIEHYLKTGEVQNNEWALFVQVAKEHLPFPDEKILIEHEFKIYTYENGPAWVGYVDLLEPNPNLPRILDYKTISDFKYCKTPNELTENTQLISYAQYAFSFLLPKNQLIEIGHLYLGTKTKVPTSRRVTAFVEREHVREIWSKELKVVQDMVVASEAKSADELPPNTLSCDLYGGCFYRDKCGLSPKFFNFKGEKMSTATTKPSFLDRLKAKSNGQSGHPMLVGEEAEARAKELGIELPPNSGFAPVGEVPQAGASTLTPTVSISPPDAPKCEVMPDKEDFVVPLVVGGTTAEIVVTGSKRRGRPKKGKEQVLEASALGKDPTPPPVPPTRTSPGVKDLTIYIDCMPVKDVGEKVEFTLFEDFIAPIARAVSDANGVADYRLIQYAHGKTYLASEVRARMETWPKVLVVGSMSVGAHEALDVMVPWAKKVIRALKG